MRAKKTVDGNRGVGNEGERETMGAFTGKKEKKGKGEEAQMGWHEGEWRQCGGKTCGKKKEMTGKGTGNSIYGNIVVYVVFDS